MPKFTDVEQFTAWAFDTSQTPQLVFWSLVAIATGYLAGQALAMLLRWAGRRASDSRAASDLAIVGVLASLVRLLGVAAGVAVALHLAHLVPLAQSAQLATAAASGLLIVAAAWALAAWAARRIVRFGERLAETSPKANTTLFHFLASVVRWGAMAVALVVALRQIGFDTTSLVAVVGAAGLAIALALQDTLKSVASGVMIAVFRPFRIGDFVSVGGVSGEVVDITPFTTVLATVDRRQVTLTNDKCWGDVVVNFSAHENRRLDMKFSCSYEDNLDLALDVLKRTAAADPRVLPDPPVWAKVDSLGDSGVNLRLRAWCKGSDFLDLQCDMWKAVKEAFDAAGISIPYPHQVAINRLDPRDREHASVALAARLPEADA